MGSIYTGSNSSLVVKVFNVGLGDKAFAGTDAAVFLWLTDENGKTMGGKNGKLDF